MPLLALPDEAVLSIIRYLPAEVSINHLQELRVRHKERLRGRDMTVLRTDPDILLVCRRIHKIAVEVVYAHVYVHGYQGMSNFSSALRSSPGLVKVVKSIFIDDYQHVATGIAFPVWSLLRFPELPNCVKLCVGLVNSRYDHSYYANSHDYTEGTIHAPRTLVPFAPVVEIFTWAAQCRRLQKLVINRIGNRDCDLVIADKELREYYCASRVNSIHELGIKMPPNMSLVLEYAVANESMEQFWILCVGWLQDLHLDFAQFWDMS